MGLGDNLEQVGRILESGFGDRVVLGFILRFLDIKNPQQAYHAITDNRQPLDGVSEKAWQYFRKLAKTAPPDVISTKMLMEYLKSRRMDLLMVLVNHPDGLKWINSQMTIVRQRLELEPTKTP